MKSAVLLFCIAAIFGSSVALKCYTCGGANTACEVPYPKNDNELLECDTKSIEEFSRLVNMLKNPSQLFSNIFGGLNSKNDQSNNFNNDKVSNNAIESIGCTKLVMKNAAGKESTVRGCDHVKTCDTLKTLLGSDLYCETCNKDGCNGAGSLQSFTVTMIVTIAATCLYYGLR
ncbi:uncharacterized protein LOC126901074 [Daktulosphaira vitifoliae]|uniref:uncharacterized protein LOC126901074 n=1 Tax=Daktulosphaira vitifoliae TaxID=58002 RepID=UPI0021AA1BA1|nr:uncharacterized protein LOC126901074 [Daktulosphaira vitifoliae]